jgi:hypothetical protein
MGSDSGGRPDARFPGLSAVRLQVGVGGVLASVVSNVNLTTGSGTIAFVYPVTGLPVSGILQESEVVIRAAADDGTMLDEFPVQVKLNSELAPGDERRGLADPVLPLRAATRALHLVIGGQTADSFSVGGTLPAVRAIQPVGQQGRLLQVAVEFERALEGGQDFAVQVSSDGGQTWQTVAVGLRENVFAVDAGQFGAGKEIQLRVITSNGISANVTTGERFRGSDAG